MYTGKSSKNPYKPFFYGLALFLVLSGFGIYDYFDISEAEQNGTLITINSFQLGLYKMGGKIVVSGFSILIGLICFIAGIISSYKLKKIKSKKL